MIEKNIPVPDRTTGPPTKYPFAEMHVGDSIFFEGCTSRSPPYRAAKAHESKNPGIRFTARGMDGGLRIWRIA